MKKRALPPGVYLDGSRFVARIRVGGKTWPAKTFDTIADAVRYVEGCRRAAHEQAKPERATGLRLGDWIDDWIAKRKAAGRRMDADHDGKVLDRYVGAEMRDKLVRELRQRDVRGWLYELEHRQAKRGDGSAKGKTLSRRTIGNALNLLRVCLEDAVKAGKATSNPALGLRPPRREATTVEHTGYVPMNDFERVISQPALPLQARIFYTIALYTGMRAGEVCGLRWENVILHGDRPEVIVRFSRNRPTKGGKVRRTPLLAPARAAILEWRAAHPITPLTGLLFPSELTDKDGEWLPHGKGYDAMWSKWAPRAGVHLPLKQLRHSCGCHLVQGTWGPPASMEETQQWLGHESMTTTERFYARYKPGGLHGLRAALDSSAGSSAGKRKASGPKTKSPAKRGR